MLGTLIQIVRIASRILQLIVLADIILSYFVDPYNPVRSALDRIVQPTLERIRRVVPPLGMIDLSPLILLILIYAVEFILIQVLIAP
ncbi:MAG: YggT family protein [Anaerolineaceae bacterium]|nr:YggT family protein [Anaerolineaceae bacterium]